MDTTELRKTNTAIKKIVFRNGLTKKIVTWYQKIRLKSFESIFRQRLERLQCRLILDLGPNTCVFSSALLKAGYDVHLLDIEDWSVVPGLKPTIYDGRRFPFADRAFDCGLAISVLHHTSNPRELLQELHRTCDVVIIQEDLVTTWLKTKWLFFLDSVVNFEFIGHPRSNKSDTEWKNSFEEIGFVISDTFFYSFQGVSFGVYTLHSRRSEAE